MSNLTLKELENMDKYEEVKAGVQLPLVYRSLDDKKCWFLTNKPNKEPEVLSTYVALLDLENGDELVYDSRRSFNIPLKSVHKPTPAELKNESLFEMVKVDLPRIFQETKGKNFLFVDEAGAVFDHYVCLWNMGGKFVWYGKETDFEKLLKLGETVFSNPLLLSALSSLGFSITSELAKTLSSGFAALRKHDVDKLVDLSGSKDLKKAKDIFDAIQKLSEQDLNISGLKEMFSSDEEVVSRLKALETFFKGKSKIDDSILPILQFLCWLSINDCPIP